MMKYTVPGLLLAVAMALSGPAAAQTDAASKPKAAKKAKRPAAKASAPAAAAAKAEEPVALSPEQLAIAGKVQVGKINCELGAVVTVTADAQSAGRFVLEIGHQHFVVTPVVSSTGAIRLEDASGSILWLQLGNKSMLMNQKEGKRLADECMSPEQAKVAQSLENHPAPALWDATKEAPAPEAETPAVKSKSKTKSK